MWTSKLSLLFRLFSLFPCVVRVHWGRGSQVLDVPGPMARLFVMSVAHFMRVSPRLWLRRKLYGKHVVRYNGYGCGHSHKLNICFLLLSATGHAPVREIWCISQRHVKLIEANFRGGQNARNRHPTQTAVNTKYQFTHFNSVHCSNLGFSLLVFNQQKASLLKKL